MRTPAQQPVNSRSRAHAFRLQPATRSGGNPGVFSDNRPEAAAQLQFRSIAAPAPNPAMLQKKQQPGEGEHERENEKQPHHPTRSFDRAARSSTPSPTQPIQREVLLKNADDNIYEDSDTGTEIGFLSKNGSKSEYFFADYTGLLKFLEQYEAAQIFIKSPSHFVGQFRSYSEYVENYGPFYMLNSEGKLEKLKALKLVFFQQRLIEVLNRGGPAFWQGGSSNRFPRALGKMAIKGKATREQVFETLGIPPEKFSTMAGVEIYPMPDEDFENKRAQLLHQQDNVIASDKLVYLSERTLHRSKNARFRAMGKKYDEQFSTVGERSETHGQLEKSFRELGHPESEGWVAGFNTIPRGDGQEKAMGGWNALGAAAYAKRFHGKPFDLNQNWEWLHVRGAQIGGKTDSSNLVAGLYAVNSRMIPYENKIKAWDQADPKKLKARFYTEGHPTGPFAEKIHIDIATTAPHAVLGNIPDSKPINFSFYTTSGKVVDKMMGQIESYKLDQLVERNTKGLATPEENRRALVPSYQAHREDVPARFLESFGHSPSTPYMFPPGGLPFPQPVMPSLLGSGSSGPLSLGRPFGDSSFGMPPPLHFEMDVPEGFNLFSEVNLDFLEQLTVQIPQNMTLLIEAETEDTPLARVMLNGRQRFFPRGGAGDLTAMSMDPIKTATSLRKLIKKNRMITAGTNSQGIIQRPGKQHRFKMKIRLQILYRKMSGSQISYTKDK